MYKTIHNYCTALSFHRNHIAGGCALLSKTILTSSLLLDYPTLRMENSIVPEQAEDNSGDAQADLESGHSVSVIPQEDAGTAETEAEPTNKNKDSKEWRKSDTEWQEMKEKAKKGESAATILEKLSEALGVKSEDEDEEPGDPIQLITKKVDDLQTELALSKWEKSHPAVDTAENRDAWTNIVKTKGHLVKSGDLSYDDLWAMVRKGAKQTTSNRDFKEQELNLGSVPSASKTTITGSEIDPDVYAVMKKAGYTDDQIRSSV